MIKSIACRFFVVLVFFGMWGCQFQENSLSEDISDGSYNSSFTLSINTYNGHPLIAELNITLPKDGEIRIRFDDNRVIRREGLNAGTRYQIPVVGLRESSEYSFLVEADYQDTTDYSDRISYTSGTLSINRPSIEALSGIGGDTDGMTLFALNGNRSGSGEPPRYIGVDREGYIVWYYQDPSESNSTNFQPLIRCLDDGRLLIVLASEVSIVTAAGTTLYSFQIPNAIDQHHDAVLLSNDRLMVIGRESKQVENKLLEGDTIVELDLSGNILWAWSAFDHLDSQRFPGTLSTRESRGGGLDWTHSNAIRFVEDTNRIILSSRSQSWVVNIDYPSGSVNWIFGDSSGTSSSFNAQFFELTSGSWFANQHAPVFAENGDLLIYDNGNESNGPIVGSRVVLYRLNENLYSAAQMWEYILPKYTASLGDVDYLDNGSVFICAGGPSNSEQSGNAVAYLLEVSPDLPSQLKGGLKVTGSIYRAEKKPFSYFDSQRE